ncbi:hypothetical protein PHLGIDRAFT_464605 [Phlebiopsis gigantea 11061_1 CR5-6]|uniref:Uncharacterized protein n=1 Tax=Phlebiopsis gigantea (strain 11061_1 CR5-6) TaxID=745531 RepID=A0A0C3S9K3_PHLG1|nr:hypothetical protein PHLGIDRAFT_464605 [Phlebiopsis gigantea 11061_1 CR5-6]
MQLARLIPYKAAIFALCSVPSWRQTAPRRSHPAYPVSAVETRRGGRGGGRRCHRFVATARLRWERERLERCPPWYFRCSWTCRGERRMQHVYEGHLRWPTCPRSHRSGQRAGGMAPAPLASGQLGGGGFLSLVGQETSLYEVPVYVPLRGRSVASISGVPHPLFSYCCTKPCSVDVKEKCATRARSQSALGDVKNCFARCIYAATERAPLCCE